jgi:hypothetical protein
MTREMSERPFDELAKGLASGSISRGRALRLMGAALVGGTLTSFGIGGVAEADNECKPTAKKCNKNKQCCSGNCSGGKCAACPSGQVLCNGSCVSTSCSEGQIFDSSSCACVAQCVPNQRICTADTPCCNGDVCANNGRCCTEQGGTCTFSSQCCGNLSCPTADGTCCSNEECTTDSDCCSGRPICVDLGSPLGKRCLQL